TTDGGTNLNWGASDHVVFLSYQDCWPHLYSIPAAGGTPLLLTPGRYMAEHIALSGDGRWLLFAGNAGADSLDIDRRHVVRVPVDRAAPEVMTPGNGLEWSPSITGDGRTLVFISATPQRPPLPATREFTTSRGAAEYRDVQAAAAYLRSQPRVDASRIGIYGGSYGGYLTALALARNSDLFAAGVDIHGVHDWTTERARGMLERQRYEQAPDVAAALDTAWRSSPVSSVGTWRSPVLLIHGDDDRNVRFAQSTDLARRLA